MTVEYDSRLGLPGQTEIDEHVPFKRNLIILLGKIFYKDGTLNKEDPKVNDVMTCADREDLDVLLTPQKQGTMLTYGKWLADHKGLIEVGAVTTLGIATVATTIGIGLIIRKHKRGSKE